MAKRLVSVILTAAIVFAATACGSSANEEEGTAPETGAAAQTAETGDMPDAEETVVAGDTLDAEKTADAKELSGTGKAADAEAEAEGRDEWAKLVDMACEKNAGENVMISPLSLDLALTLLREGTADDTASGVALDSYLGAQYRSFAEEYTKNSLQEFNSGGSMNGYDTVLEIANSLWLNQNLTLSPEYANTVEEKYGAAADTVDTGDPEAASKKINGWVSEKTHQLIEQAVSPEAIDPAFGMALINTVYMESAWMEPWYVNAADIHFTNLDGSISGVDMLMHTEGTYYENEAATAFGKRYVNGLTFIGILPKNEGDFSLDELDIRGLIKTETYDYDVDASMPKLNFETSISFTDYFRDGVLAPVFNGAGEDFAGMTQEAEGLAVSDILQKTKLELDENGTKAAAVTEIMMKLTALEEERERKEVFLDRPFAFVIYDSENDVILFAGKVVSITQ